MTQPLSPSLVRLFRECIPPAFVHQSEVEYQARRRELLRKVDFGELAWADVTREIAWHLPGRTLDALYRADLKQAPKPRVSRFDVPLDPVAADLVDRDALDSTRALERVRTWWAQRHDQGAHFVLVLVGGTGVGKTVAAAWALRESGDERSRYAKAAHLASLHRVAYSETQREWEDLVRRAPLLVIDELGAGERNDDRARAALHDAIDERQGRPTLIISNVDGRDLSQYLDARTIDRLRGRGVMATVNGPSMRGPSIADAIQGAP